MSEKVSVVGLGYVGLPLALLAAKKGYDVTGIDIDAGKIAVLNNKRSPIEDSVSSLEVKSSSAKFASDFKPVSQSDIVIVCVPTPVDDNKLPDLTPLTESVKSIVKHLRPGTLLIIESTINPGVCNEVLVPLIESSGNFEVGKNLYLAHCPERLSPGDKEWSLDNINRVVGADSVAGLKKALGFYGSIISAEVKPMGSIKEAEAVKIVENSFRDINIAFVNELAMSFQKMGINIENVIDGAATKPFAFMPHRPGVGVGGHCIPVDPYYLIEHAKGYGFEHKFLALAREINESMPDYTIELLENSLKANNLSKKSAKIVVLGQAYKPDVGDTRESPAIKLYNELGSLGYNVKRYDPFVPEKSDFVKLNEALVFANSVVIGTAHSEFKSLKPEDYKEQSVKVIIDGRNVYHSGAESFAKQKISYSGIGV